MAGKRNMPRRGHVRIRPTTGGGFFVTVPASLGRMVGTDRLFRVELVAEGILLRPVDEGAPLAAALPAWLLDGVKADDQEEE